MTAYFERYAEAFDRFDAEAIAGFVQVPCLMVNDDHVTLLPTEHAVVSNMRMLCDYHEREGYGGAHVLDVRVRESSPRVRHVDVDWRIDHREGSPLWWFTNTYQMTKHSGDWRIVVSTTHGTA
jgi:hypothetical protein